MLFIFAFSPLFHCTGWGSRLSLSAQGSVHLFLFLAFQNVSFVFLLKYFDGARFFVGFTTGSCWFWLFSKTADQLFGMGDGGYRHRETVLSPLDLLFFLYAITVISFRRPNEYRTCDTKVWECHTVAGLRYKYQCTWNPHMMSLFSRNGWVDWILTLIYKITYCSLLQLL